MYLTIIPHRFFHLVKLKHLDVSRNRLEKLPDDITKCPVLERLIVHRNRLVAFPAEMNNLRLLRCIDASYNNISHVGLELELLSNLEELNLGYLSYPIIYLLNTYSTPLSAYHDCPNLHIA